MRLLVPTAVLAALIAAPPSVSATDGEENPPAGDLPRGVYRLEKRFDFAERDLGNYEDTPMYWHRLSGAALPGFNRGRFDETVGRSAAPSFRLEVTGGRNVGYEYRGRDLAVQPESDYVVVGYVQTGELRHARAFVVAYLVDRFGDRIADTARVSAAPASAGDGAEWGRVEVVVPGDTPDAFELRLQLWIVQSEEWRGTDPDAVDPIARQDVDVAARFDDISVYRLPRAALRLSSPAALVRPGESESFVIDLYNATRAPLEAELTISDVSGRVLDRQTVEVPPLVRAPRTTPVPDLPPGLYRVRLRLLDSANASASSEGTTDPPAETLLERSLNFAVLAELPDLRVVRPDVGIDLGVWRQADGEAVLELLRALRSGAVKIGIPMSGAMRGFDIKLAYFAELSELLRQLSAEGIEQAGVVLSPSAAIDANSGQTTLEMATSEDSWRQGSYPILAFLGGLLTTWQLGDESTELRDDQRWPPGAIETVRGHVARFVTLPELVYPEAPYDAPATGIPIDVAGGQARAPDQPTFARGPTIRSTLVPPTLPTRTLPWQLSFLAQPRNAQEWLRIVPDETISDRVPRLADLAKRIVLCKTLGADRVYVPAPFHLTTEAGGVAWEPREEFIILRTLIAHLGGKRPRGVFTLDALDAVAVVFEGRTGSCIVGWTWRDSETPETAIYVGDDARAVDLWGNALPMRVEGALAHVTLAPTPVIFDHVNAPLTLLQASLKLEPSFVELPYDDEQPTLSFRNHYNRPLAGTLVLSTPENWAVEPQQFDVFLAPGETLTRPLTLTVPPRQVAQQDRFLDVRLSLSSPESHELQFHLPLQVGLRGVDVTAELRWEGDDLLIEHTLRNRSDEVVNFDGFCVVPGRAFQQRAFLRVTPGREVINGYRFRGARDLVGVRVRLGVRELGGDRRTLEEVYSIPANRENN